MDILSARRVHVVGIGGIGVSGVAKILAHRGVVVTGSDAESSSVTESLGVCGIPVAIGASAAHLPEGVDALVYSGAVPASHPERVAAAQLGIPEFSYSQALGALTRQYRTIAVSGTHGKSTTTAMLGSILIAAGLDPLILVGTQVAGFSNGNVHLGRSDFFVVEACEHEAQMMNLSPERIVVTNLEPDHLDFYGTFEKLRETFAAYVARVAPEHCVINADDSAVMGLFDGREGPHTFGMHAGRVRCESRRASAGEQHAAVRDTSSGETFDLRLRIPGAFNVMNALAAFEMARSIGVASDVALTALRNYPGSWRRFEHVGTVNGASIISDYGHHPTAVRETLAAAREFFPDKRLLLVYQPHQHHRTGALYPDFVRALTEPDALILQDVYDVKGRERAEDQSFDGEKLFADVAAAREGKPSVYSATLADAARLVREHALPDDVVLIMGAGDIYKVAHDVCSK